MYPLYESTNHRLSDLANAHSGLLMERFFYYEGAIHNVEGYFGTTKHSDAKKGFYRFLFGEGESNKAIGDVKHIDRALSRQVSLGQQLNARDFVATSDWHWVSGMGNAHPLENGFQWHHALAMPYLPGSGVKGMVRAYCEMIDIAPDKLKRWFGSASKVGDSNNTNNNAENKHFEDFVAGSLIFFDAIPAKPAKVLVDVMTPHSGNWLSSKGDLQDAPGDWYSPNPVSFLVAKDLSLYFSFALSPHAVKSTQAPSEAELDEIKEYLLEAVEFCGAGAKTAAGYGTMSNDDKVYSQGVGAIKQVIEQKALQQKEEQAFNALPAEQQDIETIIEQIQQDNTKKQALDRIEALANGEISNWPQHARDDLVSRLAKNPSYMPKNKKRAEPRKAWLKQLKGTD